MALDRLAGLPGVPKRFATSEGVLEREYVEGQTLREWMPSAGAQSRRDVALEIVRIVRSCHEAGVAHGDLSSTNILVGPGGVTLIDWECTRLNGIAHLGATPGYAGLEHSCLPDAAALDIRSDIHALGVVLDELVCGNPPPSRAEQFERLVQAVCSDGPVEGNDLPGWISRMTHPLRSRRPGTLTGLMSVVQGHRAEIPPSAAVEIPVELQAASREFVGVQELLPVGMESYDLTALREALDRAAMLRRDPEPEAQWEALRIESGHGLVHHAAAGATGEHRVHAAYLALRFGAVRMAVGLLEGRPAGEDPATMAVYAAVEACVGRVSSSTALLQRALRQERPRRDGASGVYWWSVVQVLLHTGRLPMLGKVVRALPREERGRALAAVGPALTERANNIRRARLRDATRPGPLQRFRGAVLRLACEEAAALGVWAAAGIIQAGGAKPDALLQAVVDVLRPSDDDVLRAHAHRLLSAPPGDARRAAGEIMNGEKERPPLAGRLPAWAKDEPQWLQAMYDAPTLDAPAVEAKPQQPVVNVGARIAQAVAASGRGDIADALGRLDEALEVAPRDATVWATVLQVWAATAPGNANAMRSELLQMCGVLVDAGMTEAMVAPWRMQAHRLAGDPVSALRVLDGIGRRRTVTTAEWAVAALCWRDLGRSDLQAQAHAEMASSALVP